MGSKVPSYAPTWEGYWGKSPITSMKVGLRIPMGSEVCGHVCFPGPPVPNTPEKSLKIRLTYLATRPP